MTYIGCGREDYRFLGLISSNYLEDEINFFKEKVEKEINKDISFLYVYDGSNRKQDLEHLISQEELESSNKPMNYRGKSLDIEDLIGDRGVDKERFLSDLEDCMRESNSQDENVVFMTIDKVWQGDTEDEIIEFYSRLKDLSKRYNYRFLIRYILKELDRNYIYGMMLDHEHFLIRAKDGLKIYDSEDLISQSMEAFIHYTEIEDKHEREILNSEHLKSMGELTEGVVHDTNNVLTTILGCLELLDCDGMTSENREYIDTIYKSALEGSGLMGLVLDSMRGVDRYKKDIFSLDSIVKFCIDMSHIKLRNLGSLKEVKTNIRLNSKSSVYVNEYDVRQAILNIIFNAIDAMPRGGELYLETYDDGDRGVLTIRDTGMGMSEETMDRIFEPYYTTKDNLGTGIGLSVTKKICDNHNAIMEVKSQLGEGTEFKISFPAIK